MNYIISAVLLSLAGALDAFASRICKDAGFEFVILGDIDAITQALTPPSAIDELPGVDVLEQVDQLLEGVMI